MIHELEQAQAAVRVISVHALTAYRACREEGATHEDGIAIAMIVTNALLSLARGGQS